MPSISSRLGELKNEKWRILRYIAVIAASAVLLITGNRFVSGDVAFYNGDHIGPHFEKGKITEITDSVVDERTTSGGQLVRESDIYFSARLTTGDSKGSEISAMQSLKENVGAVNNMTAPVKAGDKVLLRFVSEDAVPQWQYVQPVRTGRLLLLAIFLAAALLAFCRFRGIQIILSLLFTCSAVFMFFVPSILSGVNIYFSSVLVCFYSIISTFLIVNGFNRKTLAAICGALSGISASGLLSVAMNRFLSMSGYVDEASLELTYIAAAKPINLCALLFAAVLIGALGVIMDVSMSIASSVWEVHETSGGKSDFRELFRSGVHIGRDITGTMANTLILAYIGGSLATVLLLVTANTSLPYLLNRELVISELLQTLIGIFSILFTIPLTTLLCAVFYSRVGEKNRK